MMMMMMMSRGTGHPAAGALSPSQSQELSRSLSVTADGRLRGLLSREKLPGPGPGLRTVGDRIGWG